MIYCPECGTANRDGSKFCNECGADLGKLARKECPQCGTLNPMTSEACSACQAPLAVADASELDPDEPAIAGPPSAGIDTRVVEPPEESLEARAASSTVPTWVQGIEAASATPGDATGPGELDVSEASAQPVPGGEIQVPSWLAEPPGAPGERSEGGGEVPTWLASLRMAEERAKQGAEASGAESAVALRPVEPERVLAEEPPVVVKLDEIEALAPLAGVPTALPLAKPIARTRTAVWSGPLAGWTVGAVTPVQSILALDFGATSTRALLFDRAAGEYRFVGHYDTPCTVNPAWDVALADVRHSLTTLGGVIDRRLLTNDGHLISPEGEGEGVDAVVAVTSAGQPPRLVVFGVAGDESLSRALWTLTASDAKVERVVTLDAHSGGRRGDDLDGRVQLIVDEKPDAVVFVGSSDSKAAEPLLRTAAAVTMACSGWASPACLPIIFSGDSTQRGVLVDMVGSDAGVRAIASVPDQDDPAKPNPLLAEIEAMSASASLKKLPGSSPFPGLGVVNVLPTSKAFARTIHNLAHMEGINVLGVKLGGSTTTIASLIDDQPSLTVCTEMGMGPGLAQLVDRVPAEALLRWLPFELDATSAQNILHNKALRPHTLPQTREELLLEQAAAREIIRLALADATPRWPRRTSDSRSDLLPRFHLIVGAGAALADVPSYGHAALMLLDALQPVGVSGLAVDSAGLLAPLGAVAAVSPDAATQVLERDGLLSLGTVVAPVGEAREGEIALSLRMEHMDGRSYAVEVTHGSLEVLPLPLGQTADLEVQPARQFDIGLGSSGQACRTKVAGGVIGIIIDARGRPLDIAPDAQSQRSRMENWLWDIGG